MSDHGFHIRTISGGDQAKKDVSPEREKRFASMRSLKGALGFQPKKKGVFARVAGVLTLIIHTIIQTGQWVIAEKRRLGWPQFLLRAGALGSVLLASYIGILWLTLPDIGDAETLFAAQSSVITDRNGIELYRLFEEEDRTLIPGDEIPAHTKYAIIAIEDERFYDRGCVDWRAVGRAIFSLGRGGGASTLTRQLARNALHLQQDSLINRKLKELILGCKLETMYDKDTILELYLNWIPFGQNAYGVEQAAQKYFGKPAKDLTLAESAVLAALPQRPTYFSPYGQHMRTAVDEDTQEQIRLGTIRSAEDLPEDAIRIGLLGNFLGTGATTFYVGGRADQVLRNMQEQEYIKEAERLSALEELEKIVFKPTRENIRAPHFVLWIREQLEEMLAGAETGILEQGGLIIETTLNWELQQAAEKAVAFHREDMLDRIGANNIALLALDPLTKEVLAYVGNMDYSDEEHDGKVDMVRAPRQPGSSFKPFVYAAAFQQGYGPATIVHDVPTKFGEDEPQNFDGAFWGIMSIRKALAASRNIPAVKAFFLAGGEDPILELTSRMGVTTPLTRKQELIVERNGFDYGWPLALGAGETPLMEMVHGYSTFASAGEWKPVISIRHIKNQHGAILPCSRCADPTAEGEEVLDPRVAYQITSILSDVSARPNEYWQSVLSVPGYQAAAKTGTSNKCLRRQAPKEPGELENPEEASNSGNCLERRPDNLWTIGYTPALVTGVWVGNASAEALSERAESLSAAAPIWRDFMGSAHKLLKDKPTSFKVPEGLVQPQVSLLSGELPTDCTPVPFRKADMFLSEHAPTEDDPACLELTVDKVTGLLASKSCPEDAQEKKSFYVPESLQADRWPLWQQGVLEWAAKQMTLWNANDTHSGSQLPLPVAPTEECDISKTPGRLIKPKLTIEHPSNGDTASYPSFQPRLDFSVGSAVREIVYMIDGKRVAVAGSGSELEPPIRVPRSIKEDGTHTFTVILTDEYFNKVEDKVSFSFGKDQSGPSIRITEPDDGDAVRKGSEITITADADDDEGGIKYVQFYLNDRLLTTKPKAPYSLDYELDASLSGQVEIRVVATDFAENEREDSITIHITGDEEPDFNPVLDEPIEQLLQ
ncbi:hypothetical protein A3D88_04080 [Candidatus Peribacteria bacterium RIFCSPHIGHO2_02_FULL_52_16]|nr:MAG: hypothetical protein A2706_03435 [Candidatus Peribacteria bacterium RIFCSPHIGHO2_01_FULL_51_35]OGJ60750.1 MAG: hypothetical protein A3D88_04080 [Candidatus Peribacteria bacterium RIFCSPHIGHO2_02_FULL_52_16]